MYRNDSSGRLVGHRPGKVIELVRNPNWDPRTDYRPAYLNSITIREGNRDAVSAARRVLAGRGLVLGDTSAPGPVVKEALAHHRGQIAFVPGGAYRYVAINTTIKPFDNLDVRRAVVAAADRRALQLSRGGDAAGRLATHFLPLDFPGHAEGGGAKGTGADFLANPRGDMAVARRYMLAARREDPSLPIDAAGRWTGGRPLLMVAADADPGRKTGEVAQAQFEKLGFKITLAHRLRRGAGDEVLRPARGEGGHLPELQLHPRLQRPAGAAGPGLQRAQHRAGQQPQLVPARRPGPQPRRWTRRPGCPPARRATARGGRSTGWRPSRRPGIPFLWDTVPTVEAADVRGVVNGYSTSWDLSFTSLK